MGTIKGEVDLKDKKEISNTMAWFPYLLLAILLVISRTYVPLTNFLKSINLRLLNILDEEKINAGFQILYIPGGILFFVCLITFFLHRMSYNEIKKSISHSIKTIFSAGFVLIFTVPLVRIMINSGINLNELVSMPIAMAQGVSSLMGQIYPIFAPSIGAIGAFLAGSNTVSNLMLSQFQFETASLLGLSGTLMVAAQSVGAAAGNMVAIHNVVAASATVGLLGKEGDILRITVIPTLYYIIFSGIITFILFNSIKLDKTIKAPEIYNEKTFSGPMGMGLAKSFQLNGDTICVYNTINGQEKIILNNISDCPIKIPNK